MNREAVDLVVELAGRPGDQTLASRRAAGRRSSGCPTGAGALSRALLALDRPVQFDAAHGDAQLRRLLRAEGHRDCAAAPVRVGPDIDGVLVLYDRKSPVTLPERELAIIAELAREVGLARERAGLLGTVVEERAKMSQIVNDIRDGIVTLGSGGHRPHVEPCPRADHRLLRRRAGRHDAAQLPRARATSPAAAVHFEQWPSMLDQAPADVLIRTKDGERRWLSCSYAHRERRDRTAEPVDRHGA